MTGRNVVLIFDFKLQSKLIILQLLNILVKIEDKWAEGSMRLVLEQVGGEEGAGGEGTHAAWGQEPASRHTRLVPVQPRLVAQLHKDLVLERLATQGHLYDVVGQHLQTPASQGRVVHEPQDLKTHRIRGLTV